MSDHTYEEVSAMIESSMSRIKYKILVGSGRGGVGKSTFAVNLAYGLMFHGNSVGILDADIHGPSLGKMLGIEGQKNPPSLNELIQPVEKNGIKVISISSFIQNPDDPIAWRGPVKGSVLRQFLGEVEWGELDYLIIDLPPGTGDEAISIAQSVLKINGIIIVTTPQDVALLDARKAVSFANALNVPVIGIVENMSGYTCPKCGEKIDLFKKGGGEKSASELKIDFLGFIPIDINIVNTSDAGEPFVFKYGKTENGKLFMNIVEKVISKI